MKKDKINLQESNFYKRVIIGFLITITLSFVVGLALFFSLLVANEVVAVPNLVNKDIEDAILELQERELIPNIELKFSSSVTERGKVIEQNPMPGTIMRAGKKVLLFISKGAVIDKVDNFLGRNYDEVLTNVMALSLNRRILYNILKPIEVESELPEGTIIEQIPSPGSEITSLTDIQFLVSSGSSKRELIIGNYVGLPYKDAIYALLNLGVKYKLNIVNETPSGLVLRQSIPAKTGYKGEDDFVLTIGRAKLERGIIFGTLKYDIREYPSKVAVRIIVRTSKGQDVLLYSFTSRGGSFEIPYEVEQSSFIKLYVFDKLINEKLIE